MDNRISISPGNAKMGRIPSISLPPVITCASGCTCAKKCYAAKLCKLRKTVREAYEHNLEVLKNDPAVYWLQVEAAATTSRYFRYHVSGDIPDAVYFSQMRRIAAEHPQTNFLAFTKKYDIINHYLNNCGTIPQNLKIVFSAWPGMPMDNPYNLPVAQVIFKGQEPRDDWKTCPGNCAECACRGTGCWTLKDGETIAFYEH